MSTLKEGKKKRQTAIETTPTCWQEKKDLADKEVETLDREIQHLRHWTDMIDAMNDEQLKEYLKDRPEQMKTVKIQKNKPRQKVQQVRKNKCSTSTGIMASVWKFHKQEDKDCSFTSDSSNN